MLDFVSQFPASSGSLMCDSCRENREPLPIRDALFEMPPSTTVDEQNQFISGLTGNNLITMPKNGILTAGYCDLCDRMHSSCLDTEEYARYENPSQIGRGSESVAILFCQVIKNLADSLVMRNSSL